MLSFISGIITSLAAADAQKAQSRALRHKGNLAASNAERQAATIMRTADANWDIESSRRQDSRRKQSHAAAQQRNRQGLNAVTSQGTGAIREHLVNVEYDQILADLNKSASIEYINYFNNAQATRTQGVLQREAYLAEAQQHELAASAIRRSTAISAATGAVAAGYGYWSGVQDAEAYNDTLRQKFGNGQISMEQYLDYRRNPNTLGFFRASNYSSQLYNGVLGFNPFTASLTRKNNWGSYAALAVGNTPGFNHSEYQI